MCVAEGWAPAAFIRLWQIADVPIRLGDRRGHKPSCTEAEQGALVTEIALALLIVTLKPISLQWKHYSMAKSLLVNRKMQQRTKASSSLLATSKMKSLIWTSSPTASISRYVARRLLRAPRPHSAQQGDAEYHDPMQSYSTHLRNSNPSIPSASPDQVGVTNTCSSLPSRAVGLALLEIYFGRIYNASLLFCKPVLFQEYIEEKLPGYLLKGLFALASL